MEYTPKIKKAALVHGVYYRGRSRNATIARWDGQAEHFVHWRTKFNFRYLEAIKCPEDDDRFDVFVAEEAMADGDIPEDQTINLGTNI